MKKFKTRKAVRIAKIERKEQNGILKRQIVDNAEENQTQADSLDGILNALEKGLKSGENLTKLKINPLPFDDSLLGLTNEEKQIIKGKVSFKKSLQRFDKAIEKSEQIKKASKGNYQTSISLPLVRERGREKRERILEEYSHLLEKLTNDFKNLYTDIDRFVIIPQVTSNKWSIFIKEVMRNKCFLTTIKFTKHELLSLFVCHGFIVEHAGKSELSSFSKALLSNKDFNPCEGKILEKYPIIDIRNPDFYNGSLLKKNLFINALIDNYYEMSMPAFKKKYLEKRGSFFR